LQVVEPKLEELQRQWSDLENTITEKGEKLFDSNRHVLYEQSCDDVDGWISEIESQIISEDVGSNLISVNLLVQKQNVCVYLSDLGQGNVPRRILKKKTYLNFILMARINYNLDAIY